MKYAFLGETFQIKIYHCKSSRETPLNRNIGGEISFDIIEESRFRFTYFKQISIMNSLLRKML